MLRLLAICLWVISIAAIVFIVWSGWWLPEAISAHRGMIDRQFTFTMAIVGAGFLLTHAALGYAVWHYRAGSGRTATSSPGNPRAELILASITAIIFVTLAVTGQWVWAQLKLTQSPPDAIQIEVTGQQFIWNFRYPGGDGKFGRTDPGLYRDADNSVGARPGPLGIDPQDPAGKDDIVTGVLVIPAHRPINLILRAKDVTHDLYVPALRMKHDAVPGMKINLHFMAQQEGRFEIACAELCGLLHHQMRAILEVRSAAGYEEWLRAQARASSAQ
jgi:cytochrome c oxidase subunit 2